MTIFGSRTILTNRGGTMKNFFKQFPSAQEIITPVKSTNSTERRKYKRVQPQYNTIIYNEEIFGQLRDIGQGGLSFLYFPQLKRINDIFFELDVLCCNKKLHINRILCTSVMDIADPVSTVSSTTKARRRCIKFDALTPTQKAQLEYYIQSNPNQNSSGKQGTFIA